MSDHIKTFHLKIIDLHLDNLLNKDRRFNVALFYDGQCINDQDFWYRQGSIGHVEMTVEVQRENGAQHETILQLFEILGQTNKKETIGQISISPDDLRQSKPIVYNLQSKSHKDAHITIQFRNSSIYPIEQEDDFHNSQSQQLEKLPGERYTYKNKKQSEIVITMLQSQVDLNVESLITLNHILQQRNEEQEAEIQDLQHKITAIEKQFYMQENQLFHLINVEQENKKLLTIIEEITNKNQELQKINTQLLINQQKTQKQLEQLKAQNKNYEYTLQKMQSLPIRGIQESKELQTNNRQHYKRTQSYQNISKEAVSQSKQSHVKSKSCFQSNVSKESNRSSQKYVIVKKIQKQLDFNLIMEQFAKETMIINKNKYVLRNQDRKDKKIAQIQRQILQISEKTKTKSLKSKTSEKSSTFKPNNHQLMTKSINGLNHY